MAFTHQRHVHTETHKASAASWTTANTLSGAINAGEVGVLLLATDNPFAASGSGFIYTNWHHRLVDSAGNQWIKLGEITGPASAAANAGGTVSIWAVHAGATLATSGTFTFDFYAAVTAKALSARAYSITGKGIRLSDIIGGGSSAADAPSLARAALSNNEHLMIRADARESDSTAFTQTANYTAFTVAATSGGLATDNIGVDGEYRIVTSTSETSDPTTANVDHASLFIAIDEIADERVFPRILTQGGSGTAASSYNTASVTPTTNRRVAVFVVALDNTSSAIANPSVSGCNLTWGVDRAGGTEIVAVTSGADDHVNIWMLTARGASPTSGQLTITFSATVETCLWIVVEYENSNSIVQTATTTGTPPAQAGTLAAFGNANNATIGAVAQVGGAGTNLALRHETGYTQIGQVTINDTGNETFDSLGLVSFWRYDNDTSGDTFTSWEAANGGIGIAAEIQFQAEPTIIEADGSAAGVGTPTSVGAAIAASGGASTGVGAASGVSGATAISVASADGVGAATGASGATAQADLVAGGAGAAAAVAATILPSVATSTGVGGAAADGEAVLAGADGTSTGTSSAAANSSTISMAEAAGAGTSSTAIVAAAIGATIGNIIGIAGSSGIGGAISLADALAAGSSAAVANAVPTCSTPQITWCKRKWLLHIWTTRGI